jgi:hypothetical protein
VASPADRPAMLVADVPGVGEASVPLHGDDDVARAHAGLAAAFHPDRLATVVWSVRPAHSR